MSQDDVRLSPELIAQLNKLATYLTAQGEYEAVDLIDTVVARVSAMLGRELRYMDEGEQAIMSAALRKSAKVVRRNEPGRELLAEALDALTPFAVGARSIDVDPPGDHEPSHGRGSVTAGDLRRARAAADKIRAALDKGEPKP